MEITGAHGQTRGLRRLPVTAMEMPASYTLILTTRYVEV